MNKLLGYPLIYLAIFGIVGNVIYAIDFGQYERFLALLFYAPVYILGRHLINLKKGH